MGHDHDPRDELPGSDKLCWSQNTQCVTVTHGVAKVPSIRKVLIML